MGQMFDHELNPGKHWPSPYALDKTAELDTSVETLTVVQPGMVAHLNPTTGRYRLGLPRVISATGVAPMPVFLFQGGTDFDVQVDSGTLLSASDAFNVVGRSSADAATGSGSLKPRILGLVATGAYELETTEFVGTPTSGQLLTALATTAADNVGSTAPGGNQGKLQAAIGGAFLVAGVILCGVVSDGVFANDHVGGPTRLRFWPMYQPVLSTVASLA
jgi:hypothetical protein